MSIELDLDWTGSELYQILLHLDRIWTGKLYKI